MKPFNEFFKDVRFARKVSVASLAKHFSVSKKIIRAWEAGTDVPRSTTVPRVLAWHASLSQYQSDWRKFQEEEAQKKAVKTPHTAVKGVFPVEEPAPESGDDEVRLERCRTFADALTIIREEYGATQQDVADALQLTGQAVSHWETGRTVPVAAHYKQLLDLFPELSDAPAPACQDINVATGPRYNWPEGSVTEVEEAQEEPEETNMDMREVGNTNPTAPPPPSKPVFAPTNNPVVDWTMALLNVRTRHDVTKAEMVELMKLAKANGINLEQLIQLLD